MRNRVFISHANPDDNSQARWLALQLISLGYEVWCDVLNFKGGEKMWVEIETKLRTKSCKFLYVLTNNSNQKDGCLNELDVAESVEKIIDDDRFILTLLFDPTLGYDNINIKLKRKFHLNFKTDWQAGLKDLLDLFAQPPIVPQRTSPDFEFIKNYWHTVYLSNRRSLPKEETYTSNWFPIRLPANLYLHDFRGMIPKKFNWQSTMYPTYGYKKLTATFAWCYDFINQMPATERYDPKLTRSFSVTSILNDGYQDDFIDNNTLRNLLNTLVKEAFLKTLRRKGMVSYEMSKTTAFYFLEDVNRFGKFSYGQLVGKFRDRHWHFAISGFPDLLNSVFVIKSHIIFSDQNLQAIASQRIQQSSRRKQGKNWWNRHWKQKLQSVVANLADDDQTIHLEVGKEEAVLIDVNSVSFKSNYSYLDPNDDQHALDDDVESIEANDEDE